MEKERKDGFFLKEQTEDAHYKSYYINSLTVIMTLKPEIFKPL